MFGCYLENMDQIEQQFFLSIDIRPYFGLYFLQIQMQQEEDKEDINLAYATSINKSKFSSSYHEHKPKRLAKSGEKAAKSNETSQLDFDKKFKSVDKKFRNKAFQQGGDGLKIKPNQKEERPIVEVERQIEHICEILRYMLGEYQNEGKASYCEGNVCEDWEIEEIMKQVSDTNLGDFIIKCPNPDNIPEQLEDIYGKDGKSQQEQQEKPYRLNASQAMQFYYDLFDMQTNSKLDSERENIAFLLAFYFLKYPSVVEEEDEIVDTFIKVYNYYKLIQKKLLVDYATMRQQEGFKQKYEGLIVSMMPKEFYEVQGFREGKSFALTDVQAWRALKRALYWNLNTHLVKSFARAEQDHFRSGEGENEDGSNNKDGNGGGRDRELRIMFSKIKDVSELLRTFPELMHKLLDKILNRNEGELRNLFNGQFLKKTIVGEDVIWVNTKNRPADVATLLRLSLMYKLVVKSKLFVRSFLARDEKHIMLVVKTSEEILENYAQKAQINMEVDLGASDLFSFQPVDHYLRPLRMHSYIRDLEFREKYGIKSGGKISSEDEDSLKSIESEAANIFKKAELMNEDELRTKIITDQFQADKSYSWISNKLNIDYINQKVLVNDYNKEVLSRRTWELYYVYNKMIIGFTKRCQELYRVNKKARLYLFELDGNIGMILRLMFLKALHTCNDLFYNHRESRSFIPIEISNIWTSKTKLKNIWDYIGVKSPSGFSTYRKIKGYQRLWRKFQINELKDRSKFFPSERLIITNKVIYNNINIGKSLQKKHILSYYPLHDPYVLKNILITPYIMTIKKMKKIEKKQFQGPDPATVNKLFSQYESELTKSDFTKQCIEEKLAFKFGSVKSFSADSVRYYCGEKIAYYFQFMKFLAVTAFPFLLPAMIIQILLWKEQTDILAKGASTLTNFNNVLIFIFTFVNIFWTTNLVETWKKEEKRLSQNYGVSSLTEMQEKRVKFEGSFKRDFATDELNFEYVPRWKTLLKTIFTVILNLAYVLLVAEVILLLFLLKTYMYQKGYNQTLVNQVPSILISVASQVFNKVYMMIIRNITIFQNHKTVSDYEGSLVSKASLITFVINFYSIFIFAYFSGYLASSFVCEIKTTVTLVKITNCDYFVSQQLLTLVLVDMAVTVVGAILPFLMFKLTEWLQLRNKTKGSKFSTNFFESIDQFYQQQDRMQTYMFNEELDSSWTGYMSIINVFAATALFAPALPFAYAMMFIAGIVRLHAAKYEVIYLKKRILPLKANSINWWLMILEAISFISIITNIAYMIYTRSVFSEDRGKIFLLFIVLFFGFKYYLLSQYSVDDNQMSMRNEIKTMDLLLGRRKDKYNNIAEEVNTDIENVYYDEKKLNRKFHHIKTANLKFKKKAV